MPALIGNREQVSAAAMAAGEGRRVLPRPLRRALRFVVALASGRIAVPPRLGTVSAAGFFAATGLYGMALGGHGPAVMQAATTGLGFAVEDARVSGNAETSEIDILQVLGLDGSTSLVALDMQGARDRLGQLPWVEKAELRRVYPNTIEIALKEREAFGIWQHGSDLSLIERSGSVIAPLSDGKFASLPLFVGRDAETGAAAFEAEMADWPALKARVRAYVRVAGRRWDLHLDNGIVVKLPETGVADALAQLSRLQDQQSVLDRDIAAVDLRLPDRATIRLTAGAVARRGEALSAREKLLKKQEGRI